MAKQVFDESNKGRYVAITDGITARRYLGFSDGVVLSAFFVKPGELVAIEILETQSCWNGELRIGFTLLPDHALTPLPSCALPELFSRGQSWIFPVGLASNVFVSHRHRNYWRRQQQLRRSMRRGDPRPTVESTSDTPDNDSLTFGSSYSLLSDMRPFQIVEPTATPCSCCIHTVCGRVAFSRMICPINPGSRSPGLDKGNIVAIYYDLEPARADSSSSTSFSDASHLRCSGSYPGSSDQPEAGHQCHDFHIRFHIVLNGVDLVTMTEPISVHPSQLEVYSTETTITEGDVSSSTVSKFFPKFKVVFDVYGQTKAIRLVQLNQTRIPLLSRLCSCAILKIIFRLHYHGTSSKPLNRWSKDNSKFSTETTSVESCPSNLASDSIANTRIQRLLTALYNLPLPPTARHRLQSDANAVIIQDLQCSPLHD